MRETVHKASSCLGHECETGSRTTILSRVCPFFFSWSDDEIGEGGAISFTVCNTSFDGQAACGANDTVFYMNDVGRKVR